MKKFLVVITGPTGSGKTAMAVRLADRFRSEIVSADSRQVFKEMPIGTAQPSNEELRLVKHHLIGHRSVREEYNAEIFSKEADAVLGQLFLTKNIAILCGGSGLYINALLHGLDSIPEVSDEVRGTIDREFQKNGLEWLQQQVLKMDPIWYNRTDSSNPRRLLRALEVYRQTGKPLSSFQLGKTKELPYSVLKIGLNRTRENLYRTIDERTDFMISAGLEEEVKSLLDFRMQKALQTVGYQEFFEFFDGKCSRQEAIEKIKQHTRNYAKRQLTWFRSDSSLEWFNFDDFSRLFDRITSFTHHP